MVMDTCNPAMQEMEVGESWFKPCLGKVNTRSYLKNKQKRQYRWHGSSGIELA
jgi:hypothetical protein